MLTVKHFSFCDFNLYIKLNCSYLLWTENLTAVVNITSKESHSHAFCFIKLLSTLNMHKKFICILFFAVQ